MNDFLVDGLRRALADNCSADEVRKLEAGEPSKLWQMLEPLGYTDAFVNEEHGGIGLSLQEAFELGFTLGRHAFPLPLLETAAARSLLAASGTQSPDGPMVLCDALPAGAGRVTLPQTPGLRHAGHALARYDGMWHLFSLAGLPLRDGEYRPAVSGATDALSLEDALARFAAPDAAAVLTAPLHAAEMAGSLTAVLDMTLTYATDRKQFGRAIGQFQGLQMEISLLAELVAFATMAARMGCTGTVAMPDRLRSLNAKLACCDAAERAVPIAHAVHGAIGITEEYALGIHARRLHEWRSTGTVASAAARQLGDAMLEGPGDTLSFVRTRLSTA